MLTLERTFEIAAPEGQALERVRTYLEHAGYTRSDATGLRFTRGRPSGSLLGTDPRRWACTLALTPSPMEQGTRLGALLEVSTVGQTVARAEEWFFKAELDALGPVGAGELPPEPVTGELVQLARRRALYGWAIGLGFLVAAIAFLIASLARRQ